MALGGTYLDTYKDMFKGVYLHEAQQEGSKLEQAVTVEGMEGNKTFFHKVGKVAHTIKGARNADSIFAEQDYERRQVQEVFAEYATLLDVEDIIKQVSNPKSDLVKAAVFELGRRKDEVIIEAIGGSMTVTTQDSTTATALTLTVAVDDHSFDSGSGNVGLTTGKLKKAVTLMQENYGYHGMGKLICVAPIRQIMNLSTESQQVSGDFRTGRPLEGPGVVRGLSGFMGIDFIAFEDTGTDSNSDEKTFLITEDAIKLGIYVPLTVDIRTNANKQGNPDQIKVWEAVGAVRMFEEKVVEIACDPLA